MSKKNHLSVVDSTSGTSPQPPRKLGEAGLHLWNAVQREFDVSDAGGVALLTLAAQALDRAEGLSAAIEKDGLTMRTKSGLRAHPAMRDEIANRALCARLLKALGVTLEPLRT